MLNSRLEFLQPAHIQSFGIMTEGDHDLKLPRKHQLTKKWLLKQFSDNVKYTFKEKKGEPASCSFSPWQVDLPLSPLTWCSISLRLQCRPPPSHKEDLQGGGENHSVDVRFNVLIIVALLFHIVPGLKHPDVIRPRDQHKYHVSIQPEKFHHWLRHPESNSTVLFHSDLSLTVQTGRRKVSWPCFSEQKEAKFQMLSCGETACKLKPNTSRVQRKEWFWISAQRPPWGVWHDIWQTCYDMC